MKALSDFQKKVSVLFAVIIVALITTALISGCQDKAYEKRTYTANKPVYESLENIRKAVGSASPQNLVNPGKIYFKDNYLFVNEVFKGIHVFDNSNPAAPKNVAYINIPGNVDMAIKGNTLYADSYIDLLAIDISDLTNVTITKRIENVFPYTTPPPKNPDCPIANIDKSKGVVVGWTIEKVTEIIDIDNEGNWGWRGVLFEDQATGNVNINNSGGGKVYIPPQPGIGGSMARFTIYDNYLYTINGSKIQVYDVINTSSPISGNSVDVSIDIETVFIYTDKLFIGSQTGMYIYDLVTPSTPTFISMFNHIRSCDPVVVEGDYAYVTLRAGNICDRFNNQLDVINIKNLYNPYLVEEYAMTGPYGLGIDKGILFVCDGDDGLKVYNASDPYNIDSNIIKHFPDINSFDVIPYNNVLMMTGADGIYQYDYSDLNNLALLSVIPVYGN